jgi:hypothetical protein
MSRSYLQYLGVLPLEPVEPEGVTRSCVEDARVLRYIGSNLGESAVLPQVSSRRSIDKLAMAGWVHGLATWNVISHLTFRWECSIDSGRRCYEKFMRRHLGRVSYFYALEANGGSSDRGGFHVHALWAGAAGVYRKEAWSTWFERYGRARIEPVRSKEDVAGYCAKYVTKEGAWWNAKLQWHLVEAMNQRPYSLV